VACLCTAGIVCPLLMLNGEFHFLPFMDTPLLRPWLHAAVLAFAVSMVALILVSLAPRRTPEAKLSGTTLGQWRTLVAPGAGSGLHDYRIWLSVLLLTAAGLWYTLR
jgi:hypothetical protein